MRGKRTSQRFLSRHAVSITVVGLLLSAAAIGLALSRKRTVTPTLPAKPIVTAVRSEAPTAPPSVAPKPILRTPEPATPQPAVFGAFGVKIGAEAKPSPTPAPTQAPAEKVASNVRCFDVAGGDSGRTVEALGRTVSEMHVCVIEPACIEIRTGKITFFDPAAPEQSFHYPKRRQWQDRATESKQSAQQVADAKAAGLYYADGMSIYTRPSTCCSSILDTFEPVPTLYGFFREVRRNAELRHALGLETDATGNVSISRLMLGSTSSPHNGTYNEWINWMMRLSVSGAGVDSKRHPDHVGTRVVDLVDLQGLKQKEVCFSQLMVPGAPRNFAGNRRLAFDLREAIYTRLSRDKARTVAEGGSAWFLTNEGPNGFRKTERVVLLAVRHMPHRGLLDNNELSALLEEITPSVRASARSIHCGAHSFLSQAVHAQQADVLVSFRGADLANLIMMRPGGMVVELNVAFQTDPTIRTLAHLFGLGHTSWTCTAPTCAFGSDLGQWENFQASVGMSFDPDTRQISLPGMKPFVWPVFGYAGRCPSCVKVASMAAFQPRDALSGAVSLRNRVHQDEVRELFSKYVFPGVGWIKLATGKPFKVGTNANP